MNTPFCTDCYLPTTMGETGIYVCTECGKAYIYIELPTYFYTKERYFHEVKEEE